MRKVAIAVVLSIISALGVGMLMWPWIVPRLIYSPRPLAPQFRASGVWGYAGEDVTIPTRDAETLHAWLLTAAAPSRPCTVLFLHGNAGNLSSQVAFSRPFTAAGLDVLIIDYRGYGLSSGVPSEDGLQIDAESALEFLATRMQRRSTEVIVVGHSLGSVVATKLASARPIAGLILGAPLTSLPAALQDRVPWFPTGVFRWPRERFDASPFIASVSAPTLMAYAANDRLVSRKNALKLYRRARNTAEWLELPGGHNEIFTTPEFVPALDRFLQRVPSCARDSSERQQPNLNR